MIIRNYAKDTDGLFARIIGKISALTILQYINYKMKSLLAELNMRYFNSANGLFSINNDAKIEFIFR